ncbi:hypothetical protein ACQKII_19745 [Lysinibacillus sp. NPDC048646]|uniref:hypothetical protein n=1 Tax=Lysinibacillus sp. NPDC048646 TaxID=3390574 RepID=UPI003D07511E
MTIFRNKYFGEVLWILVIALFGVAFLTISTSYFNTKQINLVSTRCYELGGEVILEIHNNFTSEYSFECKK